MLLLEAERSLGGALRTGELGGVAVEDGADSFLARPPMMELVDELGLADDLVEPAVFGAYIWVGGALRKLPPGSPYGIPLDPRAARRARLLTAGGALRARGDLVLPGKLRGGDTSVGRYVRRRMGAQVLERLVDPLLAGTRAGDPQQMSLAAALPAIDAAARSRASLIRALRTSAAAEQPRFVTTRGGLARLIDALRADVTPAVDIRTDVAVETISPSDGGYEVVTPGQRLHADGLLLATPAHETARLLRGIAPDAGRKTAAVAYASVAVVALHYKRVPNVPSDGSGILVPRGQSDTISACTWYSTKWPDSEPPKGSLIRAFVGRSATHEALGLPDDELVARIHGELATMMDLPEPPVAARVSRWNDALPQYAVGHADLVGDVERALEGRALSLCGGWMRGSGIPDCVAQAQRAAGDLLRSLGSAEPERSTSS